MEPNPQKWRGNSDVFIRAPHRDGHHGLLAPSRRRRNNGLSPRHVRWYPYPLPSFTSLLTSLAGTLDIAIIGGTGLTTLPSFTPVAELPLSHPALTTPWGAPSSPVTILSHPPLNVAFLARHGDRHQYAPHEVPSRANIAALRKLGVRCVLAFSAVGSLKEEVRPRDFVVPHQVIDRTKGVTDSPS